MEAIRGITRSIAGIDEMATATAADEVLDRVERMVGEVGGLRHQVGDFLGNLRAV